jgi:hypothetical protein
MRQLLLLFTVLGMAFQGRAQQDSTRTPGPGDTVRVGGIIIINRDENGRNSGYILGDSSVKVHRRRYHSEKNVSTDWLRVDFGFNNYSDKTNYSSASAQALSPGAASDRFSIRNGKSINFNLWFFMQTVNLSRHYINLKYGLGIETYNFRYENNIVYRQSPLEIVPDTVNYRKNKLATDYLTVPLMLNVNLHPHHSDPIGFSIGMSAGYLYSSRQKLISDRFGKQKTHSDFNLEPFRFAYIAEINLGPIGLYGSFATRSMYKYGLDMTPYAIGVRIN